MQCISAAQQQGQQLLSGSAFVLYFLRLSSPSQCTYVCPTLNQKGALMSLLAVEHEA